MASYNQYTGALVRDDRNKTVQTSFTRPADTTAYATGDAVNDSTSAPTRLKFSSVASRLGGGGTIRGAQLLTNNLTVTNGDFELILTKITYTPANDNAASSSLTYTRAANIVARIAFPTLTANASGGDSAFAQKDTLNIPFTCDSADDALYGSLVAKGAYTPASGQKFTVTLMVERDAA
jgi:hypothetical protein